jgi:type II secretory pathway component PulF
MNKFERFQAKLSFSGRKKTRILRQLQRLINAGEPLPKTLSKLHALYSKDGKKPKDPTALMMKEWQSRLAAGKSLSFAMRGWVSRAEELIIEAGEQSDQLSKSLEDALTANAAGRSIRKAIFGGLIYPTIMFAAVVGMIYGFATGIIPTFETIVPAEEWTGNAAIMNSIATFVRDWIVVGIMTLTGLLIAIFITLPLITGPVRPILDRLPPWSIYKITQGASFMISMRGFLAAGVPIPEALRRMLVNANPYFSERVKYILAKVNSGQNLGKAMRDSGHNFPDNDVAGEIQIYAGLDNFSDSLDVLAKEWIEDSVEKAGLAAKLMNNLMLVLLAITIGYIAMSMFELQDIITKSAQK